MRDIDKVFGDDYECEGQMELSDLEGFEVPYQTPMVATSKVFSMAIKQMNLTEWKTFIYALSHIRWTEPHGEEIKVDKWELAKILGLECDRDHASAVLRRAIGKMRQHSDLTFSSKDQQEWENGGFIRRTGVRKDYAYIIFDTYYLPLFSELQHEKNYITLWADDLFQMRSERSILFYESLRLHSDTRKTNTRIYGIRDLKNMFGIPKEGKGSYMRKDGHFDRPAFEKKVIEPLCDDLKACKMISLHILEDGKPYRKIKEHGRVRGYEFSWDVSNRPGIATGEEKAALREDIDKDPVAFKIAKDVEEGKKKPKKNSFHNYTEAPYDLAEIERQLVQKSYGEDSKEDDT